MAGMVLLPGVMCDAGLWQDVEGKLTAFAPRVFGDLSQASSLEEMAKQVLAQCPDTFTLVGFSMGGFVAREMIRQAPSRVERLILIATSSQQDSAQSQHFKKITAEALQATTGEFRGLSRKTIMHSLSEKHADDTRLHDIIHAMSLRMGKAAYIRQLLMARDSDTDTLGQIDCPTLVIAAKDDRMRTVRESSVLSDGIPGATLAVIEDSGHMLPLEQPEKLAEVMTRWLQDTRQ